MRLAANTFGLSNPHKIIVRNEILGEFFYVDMHRYKRNDKNMDRIIKPSPSIVAVFHIKYHSKK